MTTPYPSLRTLCDRVGYDFKDQALLEMAVTHRSAAFEAKTRDGVVVSHNERLEFLGDAVLSFTTSDLLFRRFPERSEGELTRLRASVVNEANLAVVAAAVGVGEALRLGRGEEQTGGRTKPSLLADTLEALFAAVFVDGGIAAAAEVVARLLGPSIDSMSREALGLRDAKTVLQERSQALLGATPRYEIVGHDGPDHQRLWKVAMTAGQRLRTEGEGRSRKAAEQVAARLALSSLDALVAEMSVAGPPKGA